MNSDARRYARIIGANIRRLRLSRGLTQRDLAKSIGMSYVHCCNLERGNDLCSMRMAIRLSYRFGVELWSLLKPSGPAEG